MSYVGKGFVIDGYVSSVFGGYINNTSNNEGANSLVANAQNNGFTHLWSADSGYSVDGSNVATWTDQIASLSLTSGAGNDPVATTDSGIDVLQSNKATTDYLSVSGTLTRPFQAMALLKWDAAVSGDTFFTSSNVANNIAFIASDSIPRYNMQDSTSVGSEPFINTTWAILYFTFGTLSTDSRIKLGTNAIASINTGTPKTPDGLTLFARGNKTFGGSISLAAFALNNNGDSSTTQLNAVADYWQNTAFSALSAAWSAIT